jgi:hypothetical protein
LFVREPRIRRVVSLGFRPPDIHRGIRILPVYTGDGMGGYLTKVGDEDSPGSSAGLELARSDLKAGRGG